MDANKKYEIAILDVVKWVDWVEMAGGIETLDDPSFWEEDKLKIPLPGNPFPGSEGETAYYVLEPLNKLMCGVKYGGEYANMEDAQGVTATGWEYYYQILVNHYNRLTARGSTSYTMRIEFTPAEGANPSKITVSLKGAGDEDFVKFYEEQNPSYVNDSNQTVALGDDHISLQSHWGSGVTFANITIST